MTRQGARGQGLSGKPLAFMLEHSFPAKCTTWPRREEEEEEEDLVINLSSVASSGEGKIESSTTFSSQ